MISFSVLMSLALRWSVFSHQQAYLSYPSCSFLPSASTLAFNSWISFTTLPTGLVLSTEAFADAIARSVTIYAPRIIEFIAAREVSDERRICLAARLCAEHS